MVGLREYQPDKCDVIHKYTTDEARSLQAYGELPSTARINQTAIDMAMDDGEGEDDDVGFDFDEVRIITHEFVFLFACLNVHTLSHDLDFVSVYICYNLFLK